MPFSVSKKTVTFAFPRSARLLSAKDYSCVFNRSKRYSNSFWTVLVHRSHQMPARLGLAIAKKRAKRSTDRNKLKRVVRESFRHHQTRLVGHDLVVMNRDGGARADSKVLRQSMDLILNKIIANSR